MGTEIHTWEIIDGRLRSCTSTLSDAGRTEPYDLEPWIESNPEILGPDIAIISRQPMSKSGPIDLLGIDKMGNTVIVELKRDKLPREALAQAIDYASDVAGWSVERLGELCTAYAQKTLEEMISESFGDVDLESLEVNHDQRIILVGFAVESSLERMIQWLSDRFGVNVNAVLLSYVRTSRGGELLTRTAIISDEIEQERAKKRKKFLIPMSDEPGEYDKDALTKLLMDYLGRNQVTNQRIRTVLLPALLECRESFVTREQLKAELAKREPGTDPSKAGFYLTSVSTHLGFERNDFLRQVVSYEYPTYRWEKDNYSLRDGYRELVEQVLRDLEGPKKAQE